MDKPLGVGDSNLITTRTSVLDLPWLERTLLWSIRAWAAHHDAPQSIWWSLERAFTEAGIRPALEPFTQLMSGMFADVERCPDIRCVRCLRLGKDEAELLAILAVVQCESRHNIEQRLGNLMLPAAARVGADAVFAMMNIVANAGLRMHQTNRNTNEVHWPPSYQSMRTTH